MTTKKLADTLQLVTKAIRTLKVRRGISADEIIEYISCQQRVSQQMRKWIYISLIKGVDYGIIRKKRGNQYALCSLIVTNSPLNKKLRRKVIPMTKSGSQKQSSRRRTKLCRGHSSRNKSHSRREKSAGKFGMKRSHKRNRSSCRKRVRRVLMKQISNTSRYYRRNKSFD